VSLFLGTGKDLFLGTGKDLLLGAGKDDRRKKHHDTAEYRRNVPAPHRTSDIGALVDCCGKAHGVVDVPCCAIAWVLICALWFGRAARNDKEGQRAKKIKQRSGVLVSRCTILLLWVRNGGVQTNGRPPNTQNRLKHQNTGSV